DNTGFMCGDYSNKARIVKTTNGGTNWVIKYDAVSDQLNSMHIFSPAEMIAVGGKYDGAEKIVKSTDGGETWNDIYTDIPNKEILITLAFFDQNTGIAAGYDGKMIRTTNKGMNWSEVNPQNYRMRSNSVHFENSQNGILACEYGKMFKTSNGGLNWDSLSIPTTESILNGYNFGSRIYLIGFSSFYRSIDNGSTWQNYPLGRNVYCSEFIDQDNGFIFGNITGQYWSFNTFFRTSNGGLSWDSVSIQDFPYAMKFINPQTGFISGGNTGYNTFLSKTTNSGINWTKHNVSGIYKKAKSISFINENTGWIGCDENVLIKTTNGGVNFQILDFGRPQSWTTPKVFFRDEYNGWAAVNNPSGQLLNTTNGGLNWHIQFDCGTAGISSFHFIDNNTGWCGGYGFVLKTTNGGNYITPVSVTGEMIPEKYSISQNYPNPFNPVTNIKFGIPKSGLVKITIFDLLGREVTNLVNEQMQPGSYTVNWDASNHPSGVYFYKLEVRQAGSSTGDFVESKKMVLVK
ncbi:MAG: T9SS type A sorting domain-containing protein, partial [Ignavibacteria bacterium]|nr:T9SS type A sorting domain-containing protein [Ignavibacteria bacterium]